MDLEWLKSFEVGLAEIDDEHRQMLEIMTRIKAAGAARDREACVVLLDELVEYSKEHFRREEKLLRDIEYPSVAVHAEYHDFLLERADVVKEACKAIYSDKDFLKCCEEMFSFLIDDVIGGDSRIKSFLEYRGLTGRK